MNNLKENVFQSAVNEKSYQEFVALLKNTKILLKLSQDDIIILGYSVLSTDKEIMLFKKIDIDNENQNNFELNPNNQTNVHFTFKNEMYVFKTTFKHIKNNIESLIEIVVPQKIFIIQRRENFRVYVPLSVQNSEIISPIKNKVLFNNISLGGCQVAIKNFNDLQIQSLKTIGEFKLQTKIFDYSKIFACRIRFIQKNDSADSWNCGLQFENLIAEDIKDLQALILKIDRYNRSIE